MTTFIQLHFLTKYPVSNPNRDDLGQPKTVNFWGTPRGRISSQSLKRAVRTSEIFREAFTNNPLGVRTKLVGQKIIEHLTGQGVADDKATEVAVALVALLNDKKAEDEKKNKKGAKNGGKKGSKKGSKKGADANEVVEDAFGEDVEDIDDNEESEKSDSAKKIVLETGQLVHLSPFEIDQIMKVATEVANGAPVPTSIDVLLSNKNISPDIAMHGRMMASHPHYTCEAAVQVSHSITTHAVKVEDDFFSAVDDWNNANKGSGHIGDRSFLGGGVFHTYVCINYDLLVSNLGGNTELAKETMVTFLRAMMEDGPRGMQASYGSRVRTGYVLIERGTQMPFTSQTHFDVPVTGNDLMLESIKRLRDERDATHALYDEEIDKIEFGSGLPTKPKDLYDFLRDT